MRVELEELVAGSERRHRGNDGSVCEEVRLHFGEVSRPQFRDSVEMGIAVDGWELPAANLHDFIHNCLLLFTLTIDIERRRDMCRGSRNVSGSGVEMNAGTAQWVLGVGGRRAVSIAAPRRLRSCGTNPPPAEQREWGRGASAVPPGYKCDQSVAHEIQNSTRVPVKPHRANRLGSDPGTLTGKTVF
eukprot:1414402-Rhodomonas_salina.1